MAEARDSEKGTGTLGHPLVVLLVATVLGSVLIPYFNSRADREKLFREVRLKKVGEIIGNDAETQRHLNRLLTTLEIFHKDNSGAAARLVDYRTEQKELRRIMNDRYLEFDRHAWWWYRQISLDAELLGIASPHEVKRINTISDEYGHNLVDCSEAINTLWTAFLRETYNPSDPRNSKLMEETRKKLNDLDGQRHNLVVAYARMFITKRAE